MNKYTLNSLELGQKAKVINLETTGTMRRRLQDLGIIDGTKIECLQKNFSGDLKAFLIRGATIALRAEDSSSVNVSIA